MNNEKGLRNGDLHARIVFGLIFLFLTTRLTGLTSLPIFNDEAVYLNWARMIWEGEASPFISLIVDNKKPLQIWLIGLNMEIIENPLAAGRFASVCAGAVATIGVYFSTIRLFSPSAGLIASLTYILCPYTLLFDRQAQESSLLSAFMAWSIWLSICLVKRDRLNIKHTLVLILTTGLSLLTLSTALLFVFFPFLFKLIYIRERKNLTLIFFTLCYGIGLIVSIAPYAWLYATMDSFELKNIIIPNTHRLGQSSFDDILAGFFVTFLSGIDGVMDYFITYLTPAICFLAVSGFTIGSIKKGTWILPLYFFIPITILLGTAGSGFSRYYVFTAIPLFILAGGGFINCVNALQKGLNKLTRTHLAPITAIFIGVVFFLPVKYDLALIFYPSKAVYVERDEYQFISSQFSGYGVLKAIEYLKQQASNKKITVLTTTNWGNPADAVYVYLSDHPRVQLYSSYWVFNKPLLPSNLKSFDSHQRFTGKFLKRVNKENLGEVFFIRRSSPRYQRLLFVYANPNFQPVEFFPKPSGEYFVEIYKLRK